MLERRAHVGPSFICPIKSLQSAQYRHFCHGLCRFLCRFFFLNLLIINTLFFLCRKCRFLRENIIGKKIKGGKYIYSSIG